jgi:2-phosphoglycerate kinase
MKNLKMVLGNCVAKTTMIILRREFSVSRSFLFSPKLEYSKPQLILIGGCTGTGKSTFGMQTALSQGILKCVSTDTIRAVMRSFVSKEISPALHRSSYAGDGDAITNWRECCTVLEGSVEALVTDAIDRGVSLVVEGVHVVPSNKLIDMWRDAGGVALGVLLTITDEESHESLIFRRGEITKKGEEKKIKAFGRIRLIQGEMIRLAEESQWLLIEQKLEPDPIEIVMSLLKDQSYTTGAHDISASTSNNYGLDGTFPNEQARQGSLRELDNIGTRL